MGLEGMKVVRTRTRNPDIPVITRTQQPGDGVSRYTQSDSEGGSALTDSQLYCANIPTPRRINPMRSTKKLRYLRNAMVHGLTGSTNSMFP